MALQRAAHSQLQRMLCRSYATSHAYDLVVVGGGIVGLATAREIALRHPHFSIAVVEKERELASHQSGHSSGVIHAGIYYKPGSLKAKLCIKGSDMVYRFCNSKGIPYRKCGKVIVAVNNSEVSLLQNLYKRALQNGVPDIKLIGPQELRDLEPMCNGQLAVHSPHTGIVDWACVAKAYAEDFREAGGHIFTEFEVRKFITVGNKNEDFRVGIQAQPGKPLITSRYVITCCGLYSDRVSQLSGGSVEPRIIPFRGEYLVLHHSKAKHINGNIYPVPDPRLPFLGVHFTPRMDGSVWLGPNAILAFAREGYKLTDFSWRDFSESLLFSGMWRLGLKYWQFASAEVLKSAVLAAQLQELRKFVPGIQLRDLSRGPSGVRAQAVDGEGRLVEDFVFDQGQGVLRDRTLHVRNAPSPAATSSLAIAEILADKAQDTFKWTQHTQH